MAADAGEGSKWLIALVLYFVVYFLIVYLSVNATTALGHNSDISTSTSFDGVTNGYCDDPRVDTRSSFALATGGFLRDVSSLLDCEIIQDIGKCNNINGCEYRNTTTYFWFITADVPAYCANNDTGISIAWLYEGNTTDVGSSLFNYLGNLTTGETIKISSTPRIVDNSTLCTVLGFTWYNAGEIRTDSMSWLEFVKTLAGFSTSMGLSPPWNLVFALIFTWIPLIMLILVVRMMLPW